MADYQDKLSRAIKILSDRTSLANIVPGTISHQIAESIAFESYIAETKIEEDSKKKSISDATGIDLTIIGDFFGVERLPSMPAYISESMRTLKFYVSGNRTFGEINNGSDIIIPEGTLISAPNTKTSFVFKLDNDYVLLSNTTEQYVGATLIQGINEPIPSRALTEHDFTNYYDYINGSLLVTNLSTIASGREEESDDNYRYRLKNALRAFNQSTNDGVYEVARSVPGVSNIYIDQASNGGGSFSVYVQGITPITGDEIVNNVKTALMQECVSPWVNISVTKPNYIGLQLSFIITLNDPSELTSYIPLTSKITNEVSYYINNFYDYTLYLNDITKLIINMDVRITDVEFSLIRVYRGTENYRVYEDIDLSTVNPRIEILPIEKIIVEPISNSINITVQ